MKMPGRTTARVLMAGLTLGAGGCTGVGVDPMGMEIVKDVSPIRPMTIEHVCVEVNTDVKQAFTDGVFDTVKSLGISASSMQTAFAGECRFWLRYQATWEGFPNYLVQARVDVYENNARLGYALYDASHGGGRPDRFGSAVEKVRPLIEGMFHHVTEKAKDDAGSGVT